MKFRAFSEERALAGVVKSQGIDAAVAIVEDGLAKKDNPLRPNQFSIRRLAEELIPNGREYVEACNPDGGNFAEANFAVDTSAFVNITQTLFLAELLQAYDEAQNTVSTMIRTIQTRQKRNRLRGVSQLADSALIVEEGKPYTAVGVSEDYVDLPETVKRGFYVPITKEALFYDETGIVLARCSDLGRTARINKEKRVIDCIIDSASGIANRTVRDFRYNWKGTAYETYVTSGGHGAVNLKTSNGLVDWTDIDAVNQLFSNMRDPYTNEPIIIGGKTLLICPELEATARSILTAMTWQVGSTTSASVPVRIGPNLFTGYSIVASPFLNDRVLADSQLGTTWYLGDFSRAFVCMENWGITTAQQGAGSEDDFHRDIVAKFKVSWKDAIGTLDPRYVVRSTVA